MTTQRTPEDAKYWLDEAEQRLNDARRYVPKENARIRCEQAHYAAEFAIKGVIIATGESFATTHDIIKVEWARGRIERLIDDGNTEKDGDRRTGRR